MVKSYLSEWGDESSEDAAVIDLSSCADPKLRSELEKAARRLVDYGTSGFAKSRGFPTTPGVDVWESAETSMHPIVVAVQRWSVSREHFVVAFRAVAPGHFYVVLLAADGVTTPYADVEVSLVCCGAKHDFEVTKLFSRSASGIYWLWRRS